LHSVKPISRLEDVKGRKIRALGVSGRIVTALGGAPVGIPMVDTYDALSKGIVEGVLINWGGAFNYKMGEVTKNHLIAPAIGYGTNLYIVMNKDKWNSLPPDIQAIIDKFDEEWINWLPQKWGGEWDANGKAGIEKMGNKVTTLSKEENDRWALLMKPIFDDYVKAAKAKGLPGDEALKFCVDYLKANDK
jgi:TRAP-type C4-dicarboxylate transport system substrate-binding protein